MNEDADRLKRLVREEVRLSGERALARLEALSDSWREGDIGTT